MRGRPPQHSPRGFWSGNGHFSHCLVWSPVAVQKGRAARWDLRDSYLPFLRFRSDGFRSDTPDAMISLASRRLSANRIALPVWEMLINQFFWSTQVFWNMSLISRGAETYCTLEKVSPKVDDPVIWDDLQNKVFHLDDMLNLLGDNFLVWDNIADAPINISKTYYYL
jgi:hypothetical protein